MTQLIEDYALIGNNATAALVGRNGSIDWLSFPRFDSAACFAGLLGSHESGHWTIEPKAERPTIRRRYRDGTLVLETEFSTPEGTVVVVDCMDGRGDYKDVVRLVGVLRGGFRLRMELVIRFEYGSVIPWVSRRSDGTLSAVAGPDQITFATPAPLRGEDLKTRSEFVVEKGHEVPFSLTWSHSFNSDPSLPDVPAV